jgi:peptide-methionine (S)-S-oxide reductase
MPTLVLWKMQNELIRNSRAATIAALVVLFVTCGLSIACRSVPKEGATKPLPTTEDSTLQHATFALGCFWHSEEIFLEINGVKESLPGYCGGHSDNPGYEEVSGGSTGYAESVDVAYDPSEISYQKLLEVFFAEHDPTSLNRQGPDEGSQYRSAIFYHNDEQKRDAEAYVAKLNSSHKYRGPIVTQIAPFTKFYRAEDYHLRYYRNHPDQPYVAGVTKPEVEKFQRDFPELVK